MKTRDECLQAIFREFPNIKAAVDAGTMRVWIDDDGTERWSLISERSHVSKGRKHVLIEDDQHEEIKTRAKELQDLIEKHPYVKEAIEDHWAKVVIQEDGNLGLEFTQGYPVHLHCFDTDGVAKVSRHTLQRSNFMNNDPFGGSLRSELAKASDSPMTAEFVEAQLPGSSRALFEVGGVSIPAGSTKDFTFPVNPLSLGQHIELAPVAPLSDSWTGIVWKTWVSAINELTIRIANVTNHAVRPALQGFFEIAGMSMHDKAGGWRGELAKYGPVEYTKDEFDAHVQRALNKAAIEERGQSEWSDGRKSLSDCGI
jgi:hypothetical protein